MTCICSERAANVHRESYVSEDYFSALLAQFIGLFPRNA
jgi:hypothetical protein